MTEYRERLRRLSPDRTTGTVEWGPDGIIEVSEEAAELFGAPRDRLIGRQVWELLSPSRYLEMIEPQLVDGFRGRYELERTGSRPVRVEWTYRSLPASRGLFELMFWEIEPGPSGLPRLRSQLAE